jgi:hypothetical protein
MVLESFSDETKYLCQMLSLVYLQQKKEKTTSDLKLFQVIGNEHNFSDKSFKLNTLVNRLKC